MMMTVRHTDKSLHGDIDQQLRDILVPEQGNNSSFFFSGDVIGTSINLVSEHTGHHSRTNYSLSTCIHK
jgi:hypothetical protein